MSETTTPAPEPRAGVRCELCGSRVRVHTSGEGTSSYESAGIAAASVFQCCRCELWQDSERIGSYQDVAPKGLVCRWCKEQP